MRTGKGFRGLGGGVVKEEGGVGEELLGGGVGGKKEGVGWGGATGRWGGG